MTQDAGSFKKIAVLTGITALIGGAEISQSNATTLTTSQQTSTFDPFTQTGNGTADSSVGPYNDFSSALGTLTGVQFGLSSSISGNFAFNDHPGSLTAAVTVDGIQIGTQSATGTFDFSVTNMNSTLLAYVTGASTFNAGLSLTVSDCEGACSVTWDPPAPSLVVDYEYTPVSTTPVPAALPLFTTGLAGLGFTTWRSRRKQKAAKQS
jgi:hypothetical protein